MADTYSVDNSVDEGPNFSGFGEGGDLRTGDFKGAGDPGEIANEVTPIKVNGMLYMCTPHNIVIALDPDTGKEIWRHDPKINRDAKRYQHMICRGVSYWDVNAPSLSAITCSVRPSGRCH